MKNANGTGGIVNLGKHRRNPYAVRVTAGWADGKQIYRYIGYYATRKEKVFELSACFKVYSCSLCLGILYCENSNPYN